MLANKADAKTRAIVAFFFRIELFDCIGEQTLNFSHDGLLNGNATGRELLF